MAIIKAKDVEYVRFTAPDLGRMRSFLLDFGLTEAASSSNDRLRMRGTGDAPFVHETELGPAAFTGVALRAGSVTDLETLAHSEAVPVIELPGGNGCMVRLVDPNGFKVEVVAGQTRAARQPSAAADVWNTGGINSRPNIVKRIPQRPSQVMRLGHVVFIVKDVAKTWLWWRDRFGLLMSDEVRLPDGHMVAAFIRCDRESELADHHSLNFAQVAGKTSAFHHAAFEVPGMDDLMVGHERLRERGHEHSWGVGRHILGSQVFDYWRDPWGHLIEHWTDGDFFSADIAPAVADLQTMLGRQWGPSAPAGFV